MLKININDGVNRRLREGFRFCTVHGDTVTKC
jgi:hypothetical protein